MRNKFYAVFISILAFTNKCVQHKMMKIETYLSHKNKNCQSLHLIPYAYIWIPPIFFSVYINLVMESFGSNGVDVLFKTVAGAMCVSVCW